MKYEDSCILAWLEDKDTYENFFESGYGREMDDVLNKMFADGDDSLLCDVMSNIVPGTKCKLTVKIETLEV